MPISDRVKSTRERLGMTHAALAKAAGMAQPSLSTIDGGQTKALRGPTLLKLASALQVTPDWLMSDDSRTDEQRSSYHEEEQAVKLFRKLGQQERVLWLAIGQTMLDYSRKK